MIRGENLHKAIAIVLMLMVSGCGQDKPAAPEGSTSTETIPALLAEQGTVNPFAGDLPEIRDRRILRVLVAPSRSNYFIHEGVVRGFEVDLFKEYEQHLNKGIKNPLNEVHVVFFPRLFSDLITSLANGEGDIAAAGITITAERKKQVAFTEPYLNEVRELFVTHNSIEGIDTIDDIAGHKLVVRAGTSYVTHLETLNESFRERGLPQISMVVAEPRVRTEDILELVNAGAVEITVADEHIARLWAEVLPNIRILDEVSLAQGGNIAWAVQHSSPELRKNLSKFVSGIKKGSLLGNIYFKRYYEDSYWVGNPLDKQARKNFNAVAEAVKRYAGQYGFDWLQIMALAFQESGLDQNKRSPGGAVGIMQILPSTARDTVGISHIENLENNIHAGISYLNHLREHYFSESPSDPVAQIDFVFASYNAGPSRISKLRNEAANRGFDPDKWFFNVEHIAAEKIGRETVNYVANVNKYYFAYRNDPDINK